ncbi:casein kinase II subunit beta-like isoform X2 [Paramacrobiotus metropolitanus]|uniref:casein kinase II subunit beta-like isoform X2 n=1 Tax=Paramacrobiotus metropolitanus TaxID=2943436 RepID=UPI00244637B1|nr:casein kinase II subunit beta-like isoform X2 [Paramacrobiotus metropolitanus]
MCQCCPALSWYQPMKSKKWNSRRLQLLAGQTPCCKGTKVTSCMDIDYQHDKFNWTGVEQRYDFMFFQKAAQLLLDQFPDDECASDAAEADARMLYGLLHARFIMTDAGCAEMKIKFMLRHFGVCPRVQCDKQPVLPIGTADNPCVDYVKIYCPRCRDIYHPYKDYTERLDGAFFGTGFPHHFFMVFPELRPLPCAHRPLDMAVMGNARRHDNGDAPPWTGPHATGKRSSLISEDVLITSQSLSSTCLDERMDMEFK